MVFEAFVLLLGRPSSFTAMRGLLEHSDEDSGSDEPNERQFEEVLDKESFRFHGFMLYSLAGLHKGCKQQQFFTTSSAKFHGLSRNGILMQSQLGYMMKPTMFDTKTKQAVEEARDKVR